jgi:hypothetical protein
MNNVEAEFKDLLVRAALEPHATPMSTDDTLVVLARINAATPDAFKNAETRILYFIERFLQAAAAEDCPYKVRIGRLFVLKDGALRYTWEFTLKGDLAAALKAAQGIKLPRSNDVREEVVSTQMVKPSKGSVRPVRVGSMA